MKFRLLYFLSAFGIIILGILSRKISGIPSFVGDALYAIMIYAILRSVFLKPLPKTAVAALLICFAIESLQLLQAEWLIEIRRTKLGRYALGEGFLWSDIAAYTLGILTAFVTDTILNRQQ